MTATTKEKLCVTGASGRLGKMIVAALANSYDLVALNRSVVGGLETIQADISNPDELTGKLAGFDAVVHLAAWPFADDNWEEILPANIMGVVNLLREAQQAGVKRFVFASSMSVVGGYLEDFVSWHRQAAPRRAEEKQAFFTSRQYPRPDSLYGVSKVFGEAACRYFVDKFGMSCVCLRLAEVRPDDRPRPEDPLGPIKICRQADFIQGVVRALEVTRKPGVFESVVLISDDYPPQLQKQPRG